MGTVQSPKTRQWVDGVIEWAEDAMIETPADEAELANIGEGESESSGIHTGQKLSRTSWKCCPQHIVR